jgi:hypothetical protein
MPFLSPFHFLWNGVHLVLAPGASHSGYEDHFQADAYHYIHHRDFEYNYAGANAAFLDSWFGTFRSKLEKGAAARAADKGLEQPADAKSTLRAVPEVRFVLYLAAALGCLAAWAHVATADRALARAAPAAWGALAGFGPMVLAMIFGAGRPGGKAFKVNDDSVPDDENDPNFSKRKTSYFATVVHYVVGTTFCAFPVAYAAYLAIV